MRVRVILMILIMQIMLWGRAGDLDSTFGNDGKVTTDFGSSNDRAQSVAIQSDGKIVAAGFSDNRNNSDFAVVRYDTDGSLDSTFGGDGIVTTAVGGRDDTAYSIAIQNDGKIVAVGFSDNHRNNSDFAVVRYDTDGSLDSTFGGDGIVTTDFGRNNNDTAFSIAIQNDGKIVVGGKSNYNFIVARYNTDGSLDSTFGWGGKVLTDVGLDEHGCSVAIQNDGKIVAAGSGWNGSDWEFAVVRYNTDGSLDSTFGSDGIVTTDFGGGWENSHSVAIQNDGKIVVGGESNYDFIVVRYNTDGSLDSSFGGDGIVRTAVGSGYDSAQGVAIQSDGKIIAAGGRSYDFAVVRYLGDPLTLAPIYYLLQ